MTHGESQCQKISGPRASPKGAGREIVSVPEGGRLSLAASQVDKARLCDNEFDKEMRRSQMRADVKQPLNSLSLHTRRSTSTSVNKFS